jgi:hypothetical protein
MRYWHAPAALAAALLVSGCAGTATPASTPTPRPPSERAVGNADSGKTVRLRPGQAMRVVLTGGYWTFQGSSAPSVLRQNGPPTELPPSPDNCPPGLGCTPLAARFTAVAAGTAQVRAGRTSCGEARRCTGDEGTFSVTVVVAR